MRFAAAFFSNTKAQKLNKSAGMVAAVWLLVVYAAAVVQSQDSTTTCSAALPSSGRWWLQFPSSTDPGTSSYITSDVTRQAYWMSGNKVIAPFTVQLMQLDSGTGAVTRVQATDGLLVAVESTPAILFTGGSVALVTGRATFLSLQPASCASTAAYVFTFSVKTSSGNQLASVASVTARFNCSSLPPPTAANQIIGLGTSGFLTYATRSRSVPVNVKLPTFQVVMYDAYGLAISVAASVRLQCSSGTLTVSTASKAASESAIKIANLAIQVPSLSVSNVTLVISADNFRSLSLALQLVRGRVPNRFMQFDSSSLSWIQAEGATLSAVEAISVPPIRVIVYDASLSQDTSAPSELFIVASCADATLTGATAAVVNGVATFRSLAFAAGSAPLTSAILTFSAYGAASSITEALYTGAVTVTASPVYASKLIFASRSGLNDVTPLTVSIDASYTFSLPNIVVLMVDSAMQLDTTSSGVSLQLQFSTSTSSTAAVIATGGAASVVNGMATFSGITCTNGLEGSVLSICVTDPTGLRSQLCSASITLAVASSPLSTLSMCVTSTPDACPYQLSFGAAMYSYVYVEGQALDATVGYLLPVIRVVLSDAFGPLSSTLSASIAPVLVAYTGDSPDAVEHYLSPEGRLGVWRGTYYTLACLRFSRVPPGAVRLRFAAVTDAVSLQPYSGIDAISSGFVHVSATVEGSFGVQFAPSNVVFPAPGISSTAVIGVALPPIALRVTDSANQWDASTTTDGALVVATVSSGEIADDGSVEVITGGIATFSMLTFISAGIEPVITFTVLRCSDLAVQGKSVSTGSVLVTSTVIQTSEIQVSASYSDRNNVTQPLMSSAIVFPSIATSTLQIAVSVADSSHVVNSVVSQSVTIAMTSTEAALAASQTVTLTTGSSATAYFSSTILSFQSGYEMAPIFLKLTVTVSSSPMIVGSTLVVGPIFIAGYLDVDACATHFAAPVIATTWPVTPSSTFNVSNALSIIASQLSLPFDKTYTVQSVTTDATSLTPASLFALSPTTQLIPIGVEETMGISATSLTRWAGSKLLVAVSRRPSFLLASSTVTEKSNREVAAALTAFRPTCSPSGTSTIVTTTGYAMDSAVYAENDATCSVVALRSAIDTAVNCSASGFLTTCQCYSLYVMDPMGDLCSGLPSLATLFGGLCNGMLSSCYESGVVVSCRSFWSTSNTNRAAYFAFFALLAIPIGIAVYCCYRRAAPRSVFLSHERQSKEDIGRRAGTSLTSVVRERIAAL